jgi:hypothetical protein
LATVASEWMASANNNEWKLVSAMAAANLQSSDVKKEMQAITLAKYSETKVGQNPVYTAIRNAVVVGAEDQYPNGTYPEVVDFKARSLAKQGPHRVALLPIDSKDLFADLGGDDRQWWDAQQDRFAPPPGELLPEGPTMDKLIWETINFMDGHRSTAEIADLLSAEYLVDVDQAWVDKLVKILEAKKLVALK